MKKIYSSALLLLAGAFAITSCDKDMDSNPTLITGGTGSEPLPIVLNTPEFGQQTIALGSTDALPLTWSQPSLTNMNAPLGAAGSLGVSYAIQVSKDGNFTKTFNAALAEVTDAEGNYTGTPTGFDYVDLATTYTSCKADISADELNKAINQLNIWADASQVTAVDTYLRILAILTNGDGSTKTLAISNIQKVSLLAGEWIDVMAVPVKESYLWIPGNGNGWNHGVAPILVSSDGEVYTGYAYMDGEFKFTPVGDWSAEYNNGSFASASDNIDLGDGGGGNINFTGEPGMYLFTVDLASKSVSATAVTWSIIGSFNSWGDDEVLTYDTSNHCLSVDVNFADDTEWKFRRDKDWAINYGGSLDALEQDGPNFSATAGAHTIQLFIERPAQDGMYAVIK